MDVLNPTAADFQKALNRVKATLDDFDHDNWPWRWPWIIDIISEIDSGGQNYMEKWYHFTF